MKRNSRSIINFIIKLVYSRICAKAMQGLVQNHTT